MTSPLVIAMPSELADTLKLCYPKIGWQQVLDVARTPELCQKYFDQHGRFRLAKTNPNVSTSGLHALIGTYNAARKKIGQLTPEDVRDDDARRFVQGVELSVVHYAETVRDFLVALYKEDQAGRALSHVSAIAVEEKQVFEYNRGNPASEPYPHPPSGGLPPDKKLKAIYPEGGTLVADHPYVVLNAPWVSAAHRQAARDFLDYLESDEVRDGFPQRRLPRPVRPCGFGRPSPPYFDPYGLIAEVALSTGDPCSQRSSHRGRRYESERISCSYSTSGARCPRLSPAPERGSTPRRPRWPTPSRRGSRRTTRWACGLSHLGPTAAVARRSARDSRTRLGRRDRRRASRS